MSMVDTAHRTAGHRRLDRWLLATIAVAVLAYRPVLQMSFVGDDFMILHLVRQAGGLQHPGTYFHLNFFGYYRPVAFLSHALDWQIWHGQAFGFHLTSLLLHTGNAVLVFVFARRLFGELPAVAAALLFALHPSSHEAVFWMSARFDLLATFLMLLGLLAIQAVETARSSAEASTQRGGRAVARHAIAVLCFSLALLSKESAFAFPVIAAACDVFIARRSSRSMLRRLVPLLGVVALYSAVRVAAGGPELGQGLARLAKAALLGGALVTLVWLAVAGADGLLGRLAEWRARLMAAFALGLAMVVAASLLPATAALVRPKLAFASFAGFYLLSPVITRGGSAPPAFDPNTTIYWATGLVVLAGAAALLVFAWRRDTGWAGAARPHNARMAFLLVFIGAALLPVSSMTEGKRYLYVASIGVSLLAGYAIGQVRNAGRTVALALLAVILAVSGWQIQLKADDWNWASAMTRDAVRLVRRAEPDACRARQILFLTAPVNVRDVYCNFYDFTFEDADTGCRPGSVSALVRVVGHDVSADARWESRNTVVVQVRGVTERLLASTDLRHFDVALWPPANRRLATSIGTLGVAPVNGGQRLELRLADTFDPRQWRFLYYSSGRVYELAIAQPVPDAPVVTLQNWK
jgi:hypothetical protein